MPLPVPQAAVLARQQAGECSLGVTTIGASRILAIYPRGEHALSYLFHELAKRRHLEGFWPASWVDAARYTVGRALPDPLRPRPRLRPAQAGMEYYANTLRARAASFDTVIFTRPDQAALLPAFAQHKTIFYAIDDYTTYGRDWENEESALLAGVTHVVAVSKALGEALCRRVPSVASRLTIMPNAISADWIAPQPPLAPAALPEKLDLPRPLAGVIGSVSSRLRLDWLQQTIDETPFLNWLFVGNVEESETIPADQPLLDALQGHPRCTFVGYRPYPELHQFARALDVAVMPYSDRSTNPLGSPMRLYMHLANAQPILATPGCRAVDEYQPLVELCPNAGALTAALTSLKAHSFDDGLRIRRWEEARANTWTRRAEQLILMLG